MASHLSLTVPHDQVSEPVLAREVALRALDAKHIDLADQVVEDDDVFAWHGTVIACDGALEFRPEWREFHRYSPPMLLQK
jgi:hypothetical protein